jgi:hypothetical protein
MFFNCFIFSLFSVESVPIPNNRLTPSFLDLPYAMSHRQRPSPAHPRNALGESEPYNIIPIRIGAVRNQREHLVLHLANSQMRRSPPPDNIDVLDAADFRRLCKKLLPRQEV